MGSLLFPAVVFSSGGIHLQQKLSIDDVVVNGPITMPCAFFVIYETREAVIKG
jgi:hypothetical protein